MKQKLSNVNLLQLSVDVKGEQMKQYGINCNYLQTGSYNIVSIWDTRNKIKLIAFKVVNKSSFFSSNFVQLDELDRIM